MTSPARCRGECGKVTVHHLCWNGGGVCFTCTKCGTQFNDPPLTGDPPDPRVPAAKKEGEG